MRVAATTTNDVKITRNAAKIAGVEALRDFE
jgi:hypothetical protein